MHTPPYACNEGLRPRSMHVHAIRLRSMHDRLPRLQVQCWAAGSDYTAESRLSSATLWMAAMVMQHGDPAPMRSIAC